MCHRKGGEVSSCYSPALNVKPKCSLFPKAVNFNDFITTVDLFQRHRSAALSRTQTVFHCPRTCFDFIREPPTRSKPNWCFKPTSALNLVGNWNLKLCFWKRHFTGMSLISIILSFSAFDGSKVDQSESVKIWICDLFVLCSSCLSFLLNSFHCHTLRKGDVPLVQD